MRAVAILVSTTLVACASSNAIPEASPTVETFRVSDGGTGAMTAATHPTIIANGGVVAFSLERAWPAVRLALDSLAIPIANMDPANHVIGNSDLKLRRRLGNVGLAQYIDCGHAQGAPSAETYEVHMSVMTQAIATPSGTTSVMTTVEARAKPITVSGEFVLCTSTGRLERQVVDLVTAKLKGKG